MNEKTKQRWREAIAQERAKIEAELAEIRATRIKKSLYSIR